MQSWKQEVQYILNVYENNDFVEIMNYSKENNLNAVQGVTENDYFEIVFYDVHEAVHVYDNFAKNMMIEFQEYDL
jgi:hypothetical protein